MKRHELELLVTVTVLTILTALLLFLAGCAPQPPNTSDGIYCMNVNQHEAYLKKTQVDSESFKACISRGGVPRTDSHTDSYGHNFLKYVGCDWPPTPREATVEAK